MGNAESRPREKVQLVMSVRSSSACSSVSGIGSGRSSCCNNKRCQHRSRSEKNSTQGCPCQPMCCLPYPEFTLSTSGICYIQCDFCCEMYPCSCAECPSCGGRQPKTSVDEAKIPNIAFCPCCRQESPKANGLQNLCKPKPCCMCQCSCAEREQIANCLMRSYRATRGKQRKKCCQCQQKQEKQSSKGANEQNNIEQFHYPAYKPAVLYTCESDVSAAPSSQPQRAEDYRGERNKASEHQYETNSRADHSHSSSRPQRAENCCCECSRASERQCQTNSRVNHKRVQQKRSQGTRAQCCKCERQRNAESCACGSGRERRLRYGNNPHCPCGCEIEVRNITYDLPVCRLDDEDDDDDGCCRCNK